MTKASQPASQQASKQASKTPLLQSRASMDSAGEVQSKSSHMSQGLLVASAGFQRPGSFFVHTLPATRARRQYTNCTALHCTFLTFTVTADSSHLHTSAHTNTHPCQQSVTADKPSLPSYHTPARKLLAGACTTSTSFPASQCRSVPQLVTPILHQGYTLPQHTTPYGNLPARSTSQHSHGLHAPPLFIAAWQSPPQRAAPPTASRLQGRRSLSHKSLQDCHC